MSDSSYGSVYVEGVTYIDEREIAKRDAEIERLLQGERAADAEIERLRGLLREGITKHHTLTVVDSEPALWHYWKRVREALEK